MNKGEFAGVLYLNEYGLNLASVQNWVYEPSKENSVKLVIRNA